jgi:hypothetical protein
MSDPLDEIREFLLRLNISEEDAMKALISAFSPGQPPSLRNVWKKSSSYGNSAPTTKEIWLLFEAADFRCTKCGSQRRITLDHIDGNATNHAIENLRVLCYECNRGGNKKATRDVDHQLRIYRATLQLHDQLGRFPTLKEIRKAANVKQIGGATYLVKFLKARLKKQGIPPNQGQQQ